MFVFFISYYIHYALTMKLIYNIVIKIEFIKDKIQENKTSRTV
jgi:CRISPR/Cas system endoribonuclease Cas6 (RAMP superfamily)